MIRISGNDFQFGLECFATPLTATQPRLSEKGFQARPERPRAPRYPIVASIELTDIQSETQTSAQTSDLNLFGCHVNTERPFRPGTKVRIRMAHRGASFVALGRAVYVRPKVGMGIVFTSVGQYDQVVLEKWIAELRDKPERHSKSQ